MFTLEKTDTFTVEWIHSVELTPWRETYVPIWPERMELTETSFRSFGAGVPAELEGNMIVKDGWITVSDLHQRRNSVTYLISRNDYTLTVGKKTWKVTDLTPLDTSLELTVKLRPWWYSYLYLWKGK